MNTDEIRAELKIINDIFSNKLVNSVNLSLRKNTNNGWSLRLIDNFCNILFDMPVENFDPEELKKSPELHNWIASQFLGCLINKLRESQ